MIQSPDSSVISWTLDHGLFSALPTTELSTTTISVRYTMHNIDHNHNINYELSYGLNPTGVTLVLTNLSSYYK